MIKQLSLHFRIASFFISIYSIVDAINYKEAQKALQVIVLDGTNHCQCRWLGRITGQGRELCRHKAQRFILKKYKLKYARPKGQAKNINDLWAINELSQLRGLIQFNFASRFLLYYELPAISKTTDQYNYLFRKIK